MSRPKQAPLTTDNILLEIFNEQDNRSWTNDDFAYRAEIPAQTISLMRRGKRKASLDEARKLASTVGLQIIIVNTKDIVNA